MFMPFWQVPLFRLVEQPTSWAEIIE